MNNLDTNMYESNDDHIVDMLDSDCTSGGDSGSSSGDGGGGGYQ